MDDNKIIELYWDRNEAAIEETSQKYGNYLTAIANRMLTSTEDAKECVNDTYHGAWNSIPPNKPGNLKTFLAKILRNKVLMRIRAYHAAKRFNPSVIQSIDELETIIPDGRDFVQELEAKELAAFISGFLHGRKVQERQLFVRRYFYYEDIKTIAKSLGFSESKVKMTLKRTRDALAVELKKEGWL